MLQTQKVWQCMQELKAEGVASSNMIVSGILGSKYIPVTKGILMSVICWTYTDACTYYVNTISI